MAEEQGTEDPTAKRRDKFRNDGRIAQSRDVAAVVGGFCILGAIVGLGPSVSARFGALLRSEFARLAQVPGRGRLATDDALRAAADVAIPIVAATSGMLLAIAVAVGVAQTGGLWSNKLLGFRLDRISLANGLRRVFSGGETVVGLVMSLGKAAAIGAVVWGVLADELARMPLLALVPADAALAELGRMLVRIAAAALAATAVLAAADWWLNHRKLERQMKMTKQQVKDEHKQQEGDPQVKSRMRQRMRQIGRNRMIASVRQANVVVVNPTHYAVAIAYELGQAGAPKLLAKGVDHLATKIREEARKHGVPIVSNPPVARAIYATARVGREIPPELYELVARVLAYLYRMTRWRHSA